jgi:hypothetical protein
MADNTFSSIAQGYSGAQDALRGLGMLPGSFRPMDGGGASLQVPTIAPMHTQPMFMPRPPMSSTLPFPSQSPQFAPQSGPGIPAPMHPSMMSPRMSAFAPQQGTYLPPVPAAPTAMGTLEARRILMGQQTIGTNQNVLKTRAQAAATYGAFSDSLSVIPGALGAGFAGSKLGGAVGAMAGGVGAPVGAALGGIAASMGYAAFHNYADDYAREREQHAAMGGYSLRGVTSGNMVGAFGTGISPMKQMQLSKQMISQAKQSGFHETLKGGDFSTTLGMASEMGLMRGHTNDVGQTVSRVKNLATVARDIMRLGEGITQQDAMELQALTQGLGVSTGTFQTHNLGQKLVTAAKVAGVSPGQATQQGFVAGAQAFQQAGMSSVLGGLTGLSTLTQAGSIANSGNLTASQLAALGGQRGLHRSLLGAHTGFLSNNMGSMALGSIDTDGNLDLDSFQSNLLGSGGSVRSMNLRGRKALRGDDLTSGQIGLRKQLLLEKMPDMTRKMQEEMTPMQTNALMVRQVTSRMEEAMSTGRFVTDTQAAASLGVAPEQWSAVKSSMSNIDSQVRDINRQERLVSREKRARGAAEYDDMTRKTVWQEYAPDWAQSAASSTGEFFSDLTTVSEWDNDVGRMVRRRTKERAVRSSLIEANAAGSRLGQEKANTSSVRFNEGQRKLLNEEGTQEFLDSLGGLGNLGKDVRTSTASRGGFRMTAPELGRLASGQEETFGDDFQASETLQRNFNFLDPQGGDGLAKFAMTASEERDYIYDSAKRNLNSAGSLKYYSETVGGSTNRSYIGDVDFSRTGRGLDSANLSDKERSRVAALIKSTVRSTAGKQFDLAFNDGKDPSLKELTNMNLKVGQDVDAILKRENITLTAEDRENLRSRTSELAERSAAQKMGETEKSRKFGAKYISSVEGVINELSNEDFAFNDGFKNADSGAAGINTFLNNARPSAQSRPDGGIFEELIPGPWATEALREYGRDLQVPHDLEDYKGKQLSAHFEVLETSGLSGKDQKLAMLAMGFRDDQFDSGHQETVKRTGFNKDQIQNMRRRMMSGDLASLGKKYTDKGWEEGADGVFSLGDSFNKSNLFKDENMDKLIKAKGGQQARSHLNIGLGNIGFHGGGNTEGLDSENDTVEQLKAKDFLSPEEIQAAVKQATKTGVSVQEALLGKEGMAADKVAKVIKSGSSVEGLLREKANLAQYGTAEEKADAEKAIRAIVQRTLVDAGDSAARQGESTGSSASANAGDFGNAVKEFKTTINSMNQYASGKSLETVLSGHLSAFRDIRDSLSELKTAIVKLKD